MRTRLIVVFLACLIPHSRALAQETPTPDPIVEELSFPGGTLGEYVVVLRAAVEPEPVNIILRGTASEIDVPEINLQMVAVATAIEIALPDPFEEQMVFDDDGEMHRIIQRFDTYGYGEPGSLVIVIERQVRSPIEPPEGQITARRRDTMLEVFVLSELVTLIQAGGTDIDIDTMIDAVETALDTGGNTSEADLRYHEASTLLIVRGTGEQVHTVEQVLRQFYKIAEGAASMERARRVLAVVERIAVIEMDGDMVEDRVKEIKDRIKVARNSRPWEAGSEEKFEDQKHRLLATLRAEYEPIRHEYEELGAQLSRLRAMRDMLADPEAFSDAAALAATDEFATDRDDGQ